MTNLHVLTLLLFHTSQMISKYGNMRVYQIRALFKMSERVKSQPLDQSLLCYLILKTAAYNIFHSLLCASSLAVSSLWCYYRFFS